MKSPTFNIQATSGDVVITFTDFAGKPLTGPALVTDQTVTPYGITDLVYAVLSTKPLDESLYSYYTGFEYALRALKNGDKVSRGSWIDQSLETVDGIMYKITATSRRKITTLPFDDMLAEDWFVVSPEGPPAEELPIDTTPAV